MASLILVVEDDPQLAASLVRRLRRDGYQVELSVDGDDAIQRAPSLQPDLVLLDLMLPRRSGLEVLERLRQSRLKTIVVTARVELTDRLRCFELGAVDYVPKPFFLDEISARVRARLGVVEPIAHRTICFGQAALDLDARTVAVNASNVSFTPSEFNILAYLAERPGRTISRAQIVQEAFPASEHILDRIVDTHIARVRRKLGLAGAAIVTVWGVGYRFDPEAR